MFFPYSFDQKVEPLLRCIGVRSDRDGVRTDDERVVASFGPLNLSVERDNIKSISVTGPYQWFKVLGPRLSMADHGLTFGTSTSRGVCIEFHRPVPPVIGPWAHPGVTLTVSDPEGLAAAIGSEA